MRIGDIVEGDFTLPRIPGSVAREPLLSYSFGMFSTAHDTIELWEPGAIRGIIVKIDKDISGYGNALVQVLLERRCLWFFSKDLTHIKIPVSKETK